MSNHTYPRFDSVRKLSPKTSLTCNATGCTKQATKRIWVQESYMRGDDEAVVCCDDHGAIKDCEEFCKQFPPTAWR